MDLGNRDVLFGICFFIDKSPTVGSRTQWLRNTGCFGGHCSCCGDSRGRGWDVTDGDVEEDADPILQIKETKIKAGDVASKDIEQSQNDRQFLSRGAPQDGCEVHHFDRSHGEQHVRDAGDLMVPAKRLCRSPPPLSQSPWPSPQL